jgi:RND superfamily putative drug exporter
VAGWLLALVVLLGLSRAVGSSFNSDNSLPNTDSQAAATLLTENFPAAANEGDLVVIQATRGATIESSSVQTAVSAALAEVAKVPGVAAVASPYASSGAAQISQSGTIAYARVTWDMPAAQVTTADADKLIAAAQSADGANVQVSPAASPSATRRSPVSAAPSSSPSSRR